MLGQGVGVQVVTGAGQAGHAVSGGGAQAALSQMQSRGEESLNSFRFVLCIYNYSQKSEIGCLV